MSLGQEVPPVARDRMGFLILFILVRRKEPITLPNRALQLETQKTPPRKPMRRSKEEVSISTRL
jgi:hypothetical protein